MTASLYVTGTDTGIGKTFASVALLHALRARQLRVVGMKPVASGCAWNRQGWRNDDALALQEASMPVPAYADLNPVALPQPVSPEIAARQAGVEISLESLTAAFSRLRAQADAVVVEGVGGWAAPLSATLDQRDLVRAWRLPVVLVVGVRLGCINHARLAARALAGDGVELAGWIANVVEPGMDCLEENLASLGERLPVPCWGRIPHCEVPPAPAQLAAWLPGATAFASQRQPA